MLEVGAQGWAAFAQLSSGASESDKQGSIGYQIVAQGHGRSTGQLRKAVGDRNVRGNRGFHAGSRS